MTARMATSAKLDQVLVYYDGPQVAALRSSRGHKMLAVAIDHPDYELPFMACEVVEKIFDNYVSGRIDLLYALHHRMKNACYIFDWMDFKDGSVKIRVASEAERENADYYPESGFFAQSHTSLYLGNEKEDTKQERFAINGSWEAEDFSRFCGKLAEAYSFGALAEKLSHQALSPNEAKHLFDAVNDRYWERGGSSTAFYGDLLRQAPVDTPLRVTAIAYNSPGYIDVKGDESSLSDLIALLGEMAKDPVGFDFEYKRLHGYLKGFKLLGRAAKTSDVSEDVLKSIYEYSMSISGKLMLPSPKEIYNLCDRNEIVFAKLILSYFRRVREIFSFYEQGRVA